MNAVTTTEEKRTLTAEDRCDRCAARAVVITELDQGALDLLWCAHHWHEVSPTMRSKFGDRLAVTDTRDVNV